MLRTGGGSRLVGPCGAAETAAVAAAVAEAQSFTQDAIIREAVAALTRPGAPSARPSTPPPPPLPGDLQPQRQQPASLLRQQSRQSTQQAEELQRQEPSWALYGAASLSQHSPSAARPPHLAKGPLNATCCRPEPGPQPIQTGLRVLIHTVTLSQDDCAFSSGSGRHHLLHRPDCGAWGRRRHHLSGGGRRSSRRPWRSMRWRRRRRRRRFGGRSLLRRRRLLPADRQSGFTDAPLCCDRSLAQPGGGRSPPSEPAAASGCRAVRACRMLRHGPAAGIEVPGACALPAPDLPAAGRGGGGGGGSGGHCCGAATEGRHRAAARGRGLPAAGRAARPHRRVPARHGQRMRPRARRAGRSPGPPPTARRRAASRRFCPSPASLTPAGDISSPCTGSGGHPSQRRPQQPPPAGRAAAAGGSTAGPVLPAQQGHHQPGSGQALPAALRAGPPAARDAPAGADPAAEQRRTKQGGPGAEVTVHSASGLPPGAPASSPEARALFRALHPAILASEHTFPPPLSNVSVRQ